MAVKVVIGHTKQIDDNGTVENVGISLIDLFNILNDIRTELKKVNIQLQVMSDIDPNKFLEEDV